MNGVTQGTPKSSWSGPSPRRARGSVRGEPPLAFGAQRCAGTRYRFPTVGAGRWRSQLAPVPGALVLLHLLKRPSGVRWLAPVPETLRDAHSVPSSASCSVPVDSFQWLPSWHQAVSCWVFLFLPMAPLPHTDTWQRGVGAAKYRIWRQVHFLTTPPSGRVFWSYRPRRYVSYGASGSL